MLTLGRNAFEITTKIRTLPWDETRTLGAKAHEIAGMTVGIVGVGEIGKRVARICRQGFGMRVLGNQRRVDQVGPDAEPADLDSLVAASDFVILTCPLTPETHHLFNRKMLAKMKSTAWLVNVGRGAVVEEAALIEALREQRIAGVMLDVYEHYRLEPGHPLLSLPNAILTPHLAGMTQESRKRMGAAAAEETLRMLAGEAPKNFVNPEVWSKFIERRSQDR
jgi:D-3-phosphoglycerate dehydrogenase